MNLIEIAEIMISVIIPVYNLENYIERCIKSVLIQTFKNFEVICVDDKSQDRTVEIIEKIAKTDSRVKLLRQPKNSGPAMARSYGCRESKGSYIFFLDGDDTLPSNALELLYTKIKDSKVDIVRGSVVVVDFDGNRNLLKCDSLPYGSDRYGIYRALLEGCFRHNLCFTLFNRSLLTDYTYLFLSNMRNGEDAYLFYQLVENIKNGIEVISEIVYFYQMNPNSSSHIELSDNSLDGLLVFHKYVTSIDFRDDYLEKLSYRNSTKLVNYHALRNGFKRVEKSIEKISAPPFLSMKYRIRYMSFFDLIIFYVRVLILNLKKIF